MPLYEYQNEGTGESKLISQGMNDEHTYSENGIKWTRIFSIPQAAFDTVALDPFNKKDFTNKTGKGKGVLGDLFKRSREMSEKRKALAGGQDVVADQYKKDYAKARKGKVLPTRNGNHYYEDR